MRRKWQLIITSAIVLLIISCVYMSMTSTGKRATKAAAEVVRDIKKGDTISNDMVRIIEIPADLFNNSLGDKDMFIGKTAGRDIGAGDIISVNDIEPECKVNDYPVIGPGKRLFSMHIEPEQANGCWLFENNMIDLYLQLPVFTNDQGTAEEITDTISSSVIVVENVRIIRIMDENGSEISNGSGSSRILSLELDPEIIKIVAFSVKNGNVSIAAISDQD